VGFKKDSSSSSVNKIRDVAAQQLMSKLLFTIGSENLVDAARFFWLLRSTRNY
jgi:hypothetical protein